MSLATLKRKTSAKYNNSSVNSSNGFSLNGSYRNQGYVGQTSLSRSLPKTPMKGNTVRGHGGKFGVYKISSIVQSAVKSTEDNSVVKKSVLTNDGMLDTRFICDPCNTVKPDSNLNSNSISDYIDRKKRNATNCPITFNTDDNVVCCGKVSDFTKPATQYLSLSGSEHLLNIKSRCVSNDIVYVPVNYKRTPLEGN